MHSVFLFGALSRPDILCCVLGRDTAPEELGPCVLPGHRVCEAPEGTGGALCPEEKSRAEGLLLAASEGDREKLDFYLGAPEWQAVTVIQGGEPRPALTFRDVTAAGSLRPWNGAAFDAEHADATCEAARRLMALRGRISARDAGARRAMLENVAARSVIHPVGSPATLRSKIGPGDVEVRRYRRAYQGFFALDEMELRHPLFAGGMSEKLDRSAFVSFDATIVLPYDPARDRVALVEQFRMGPFLRGDSHPWMLEPVAGRVDPGETPEETARRETLEETGIVLRDLIRVSAHYPSPGATTEFYHCFIGTADLPDAENGPGGLDSEGEDIRTHLVGFDTLMELLDSGEAEVGPLIVCAMWLARHRDRLRAGA